MKCQFLSQSMNWIIQLVQLDLELINYFKKLLSSNEVVYSLLIMKKNQRGIIHINRHRETDSFVSTPHIY